MITLDKLRVLLAELESLAPKADLWCVEDLRTYAEPLISKASEMGYSDVSGPEALLLAATITLVRRRLRVFEGG
jgi:hypothetical protein